MTGFRLSFVARTAILALTLASTGIAVGDDTIQQARQHLESGEIRTAVIELKGLLQQDPGRAEARLLLGKAYLRVRDGAAAEAEFRRAAEIGVPPEQWRLGYAEALLLQGKNDEAMERLSAGTLPPEQQSAVETLTGLVYFGKGDKDKAKQHLTLARELEPTAPEPILGLVRIAFAEDDLVGVSRLVDQLLAEFPENLEGAALHAKLLNRTGEYEQALERLQPLLNQQSDYIPALIEEATALVHLRRYDEARAIMEKLEGFREGIPRANLLRAVIAVQQGNFVEAKTHLQGLLRRHPMDYLGTRMMGVVSEALGESEAAIGLLSKVLRMTPEDGLTRKSLAAAYLSEGQGELALKTLEPISTRLDVAVAALLGRAYFAVDDLKGARKWLRLAVEGKPDDTALRTLFARVLYADGAKAKALDQVRAVAEQNPDVDMADVVLVFSDMKSNRFDRAFESIAELERRQPASPIPPNLSGLVHLAKGDPDAAAERFEKALELDPAFHTAYLNLAMTALVKEDRNAARAYYGLAIEADPGNFEALMRLASLAAEDKRWKIMIRLLSEANRTNSGSAVPALTLIDFYLKADWPDEALTIAQDLATRFPEDQPVLEILARAQADSGDTLAAKSVFDRLLDTHPTDARLRVLAGNLHRSTGDDAKAEMLYEEALELAPDLIDARVARTLQEVDRGNYKRALGLAKDIQKKFPRLARGYGLEGRIQSKKGEPKKAVSAFRKALRIEPGFDTVRLLAINLDRLNRRDEAIEIFEIWLKDHPEDRKAQAILAQYYQQAGRPQDAARLYELLTGVPKPNPVLLNNLAVIYQQMGDPRAERTARQAFDATPNRADFADTLGWVLVTTGKLDEGIRLLQQAQVTMGADAGIAYHLGSALVRAGRNDEAKAVLRRAPTRGDAQTAKGIQALLDQLGD